MTDPEALIQAHKQVDDSGTGWIIEGDPAFFWQTVRQPSYEWHPQPDITAYELALCMPIMIGNWPEGVEGLPDEAKRHFVKVSD